MIRAIFLDLDGTLLHPETMPFLLKPSTRFCVRAKATCAWPWPRAATARTRAFSIDSCPSTPM